MPFIIAALISLLFLLLRYFYAKADFETIKFISSELGLEFQSIDEGGISSSKGINFGFNKLTLSRMNMAVDVIYGKENN